MNRKKEQNITSNVNKDAFQRINYLYHCAHLTLAENREISRFYISTMRKIARKLVIRLDPEVKRTICDRCDTLQVPGISCTIRVEPDRESHVVVKCGQCGDVKRFNTAASKRKRRTKQRPSLHPHSKPTAAKASPPQRVEETQGHLVVEAVPNVPTTTTTTE